MSAKRRIVMGAVCRHDDEEVPGALLDLVSGTDWEHAMLCEFDAFEETIFFVEYKSSKYFVGIGESLRPTITCYDGESREEASACFIDTINKHRKA